MRHTLERFEWRLWMASVLVLQYVLPTIARLRCLTVWHNDLLQRCAADTETGDPCPHPPLNFKTARFCLDHEALERVCGIKDCHNPVAEGSKACALEAHADFYNSWRIRFQRLSIHGVRRAMDRQQDQRARGEEPLFQVPAPNAPLQDDGAPLEGNIEHNFSITHAYCIETITWSCGFPIAFKKLLRSEGEREVVAFLNDVWPEPAQDDAAQHSRPDYIGFDRACRVLAFLLTSVPNSPWLTATRFIVDAWHYINHRASDALCRERCNPAPNDGSQPDLIIETHTDDGRVLKSRAFNTEAAEQLNAWLIGFKTAANKMTTWNFEFFIFSILFLHAQNWIATEKEKNRRLAQRQRNERRVQRARLRNNGLEHGESSEEESTEEEREHSGGSMNGENQFEEPSDPESDLDESSEDDDWM